MTIQFDYFYGNAAEQFAFYRIPKVLFKDAAFQNISTDAKVLYGLMLDRMSLSVKNRWFDEKNRVYIIYTIEDIMEDLHCADQKAGKLLSELDTKKGVGLIERIRQGLGKPNIIYVKNFIFPSQIQNRENHDSENVNITNQEPLNSQVKKSDNHTSGFVNCDIPEQRKSQTNNTEYNDTENNDTENNDIEIISYPTPSPFPTKKNAKEPDMIRWMEERKDYERLIKENIDYDIIEKDYGSAWLDEIVALMVDVVCSRKPTIRINKQNYPQEVVKSRFLKIDSTHIEYIYLSLKDNTSNVRNIRAFLITTIFRSFETADNWYAAKVNHDMAQGGF